MAKTGVFLRGARGKFAGSVLYKGERGTIIRENVIPSNPQSVRQMCQRVAFATVASAARFMLPVIGETFLGAGNEKVNRRAFIANNVNTLRDWFYKASKGVPNIPARATAKGYSVLVPNQYVISKGGAVIPSIWNCTQQFSLADGFSIGYPELTCLIPDGTYTAAELLKSVLGLSAGEQITLVGMFYEPGSDAVLEINGDRLERSEFKCLRVCVKDDLSAVAGATIASGMDVADVYESVLACFDTEKSDASFLSAIESILAEEALYENGFFIDHAPLLNHVFDEVGWVDSNNPLAAAQCILSVPVGKSWDYSSSVLAIDLKKETYYWGLNYPNALTTFIKSGASESTKFTQAGGSDNSVG